MKQMLGYFTSKSTLKDTHYKTRNKGRITAEGLKCCVKEVGIRLKRYMRE